MSYPYIMLHVEAQLAKQRLVQAFHSAPYLCSESPPSPITKNYPLTTLTFLRKRFGQLWPPRFFGRRDRCYNLSRPLRPSRNACLVYAGKIGRIPAVTQNEKSRGHRCEPVDSVIQTSVN